MTNTANTNNKIIAIPAHLTIETASAFADILQNLILEQGETVILDAANTEIITTPGVQLLLSFDRTLTNNSVKLALINISKELRETLVLMGLETLLEKWKA